MQFSTHLAGTPVSYRHVALIKEMYPYPAHLYRELRVGLEEILIKYPDKKLGHPDQVLALSQHDGMGQIWSIVLVDVASEFEPSRWVLAGHQGHRDNVPLTTEQIESGYIDPHRRRYLAAAATERQRKHLTGTRALKVIFVVMLVISGVSLQLLWPLNFLEYVGLCTLILVPVHFAVEWADKRINPKQDTLALKEKWAWEISQGTTRLALKS